METSSIKQQLQPRSFRSGQVYIVDFNSGVNKSPLIITDTGHAVARSVFSVGSLIERALVLTRWLDLSRNEFASQLCLRKGILRSADNGSSKSADGSSSRETMSAALRESLTMIGTYHEFRNNLRIWDDTLPTSAVLSSSLRELDEIAIRMIDAIMPRLLIMYASEDSSRACVGKDNNFVSYVLPEIDEPLRVTEVIKQLTAIEALTLSRLTPSERSREPRTLF